MLVLSHYQAQALLAAWQKGSASAFVSPDLNLSQVEVRLSQREAHFPGGETLSEAQAQRITAKPNACFTLEDGEMQEIKAFSEVTGWARSLYPTEKAPTMLVAGLTMHRIVEIDPYTDTLEKIKAARPQGQVLDTATGLGYTAIEAARRAQSVVTVELDPASLEIARANPWSQPLFTTPNITSLVMDIYNALEGFAAAEFTSILHDPPAFNLAGDLYSAEIYAEFYRVLGRRGRLFHYIGDLSSKSGAQVAQGVIKRLGQAGFKRVERHPKAFGVTASK